jgi:VIT1/CCC1 family predicted Fe2+/Mn2+ transporter
MSLLGVHPEAHLIGRIGWLRAVALGANDGIVSTASVIVGVAAAEEPHVDDCRTWQSPRCLSV